MGFPSGKNPSFPRNWMAFEKAANAIVQAFNRNYNQLWGPQAKDVFIDHKKLFCVSATVALRPNFSIHVIFKEGYLPIQLFRSQFLIENTDFSRHAFASILTRWTKEYCKVAIHIGRITALYVNMDSASDYIPSIDFEDIMREQEKHPSPSAIEKTKQSQRKKWKNMDTLSGGGTKAKIVFAAHWANGVH